MASSSATNPWLDYAIYLHDERVPEPGAEAKSPEAICEELKGASGSEEGMKEWLGKMKDSTYLLMIPVGKGKVSFFHHLSMVGKEGDKWGGIRGFGLIPQVETFQVKDVAKNLVSKGIEEGHLVTKLPSPNQLLKAITIAELKDLVGESDKVVRDLVGAPFLQVVGPGIISPCTSRIRSSVGTWEILHEIIVNKPIEILRPPTHPGDLSGRLGQPPPGNTEPRSRPINTSTFRHTTTYTP